MALAQGNWHGGTAVAVNEVEDIERLIEPSLEAMGYRLVRTRVLAGGRRRLQVMAEPSHGGDMTLEDCAELSRAISVILDAEDPLSGPYVLEVSSPGIDRPLVRIGDFERFAGREARIELARPIDGRKRFRGTLLGVAGAKVRLALAEGPVEVPFQDISAAKLMMSDAVIAASLKRREV